jgi:hypothetical protein
MSKASQMSFEREEDHYPDHDQDRRDDLQQIPWDVRPSDNHNRRHPANEEQAGHDIAEEDRAREVVVLAALEPPKPERLRRLEAIPCECSL